MNKFEFSKLILVVAYVTAIVFTVITAYIAVVGGDAASFANIVLAIWALVSTAVGFYFWKAKAENIIKLAGKLPEKLHEQLDQIKNFLE